MPVFWQDKLQLLPEDSEFTLQVICTEWANDYEQAHRATLLTMNILMNN